METATSSSYPEPLLELPGSEWQALHALYQSNWPYGVGGYCLIDMLLSNPGLVESFNFTIYCPRGKIEKGMVATSITETYHMYICPVKSENLACIEESLLRTRLIDWNNNIIVPSVSSDVMKMIDRVSNVLKLEVKCNGFVAKYLKTVDSLSTIGEFSPPPETYIGPLRPEHLQLFDATWAFRSESSVDYFRRLMDNNLTYVLYRESNHQPLAWVAIDETGALAHLYSIERCRRHGLASYVTKIAVTDLMRNGQHVLAYSLMDNFASQRFFIKLGFKNLGVASWIFLSRKVMEVPSCAYCRIVEFHPTPPNMA